ncbi:MAG: type IV secretory system conjugative DNA transfer family protein, partial [Streptococcus sp.]
MITEKKKRLFRPYLLLGIGLFYLFHWLFKLWLLAPATDPVKDIFGLGKINWMSDHLGDKAWFDFQFTPASLLAGLGGFLIAFLLYLRVSDTGTYRYGEEHGSARFATKDELLRFRDAEPEKNMIFTQNSQMGLFNSRLSYENQINKNVLVYGGTGDSKTRSAVKPNILQGNSSFVTTDTKGILIHETGKSIVEKGYKIKIFDLITFLNSDGFNVFKYIHTEMDIDRVSEAITESLNRNGHEGDPFWPAANKLLMRSLIGYLYFDGLIDHYLPNLGQVTDMIRELRRNHPDAESPVELMFEDLERRWPGNYASRQWALFNKNFDGQTRASVYAIFATTFSVFDHEQLRKIIEKDTLEIEKWNIEKTAVFIHIPEVDPAYQFLSALLFSTIFDVLIKTADA